MKKIVPLNFREQNAASLLSHQRNNQSNMKTNKLAIVAAIVAAVSFWAVFPQTVGAASTTVTVGLGGSDVFSPSSVSISVNDSVIWSWSSSFHSTTSGTNGVHGDDNGVPSGSWDSTIFQMAPPHFFTNTFTSAGTFKYYCSVHFSIGMTGQVLVAGATLPPSLAISSPSNGAVFAAPANVNIQASVTNGTAAVTNVEFLAGNTLLANVSTGPFSTTANNLAAGNYMLSAIAQDNGGLSATNTVNISVVTPVAVSLTGPFMLSGNNFKFNYSANVNLNYVVQRSSNLIDWVSIATNTAAGNPVNFSDPNATDNLNFYRVGRLPNP
jgi:plastocyanin